MFILNIRSSPMASSPSASFPAATRAKDVVKHEKADIQECERPVHELMPRAAIRPDLHVPFTGNSSALSSIRCGGNLLLVPQGHHGIDLCRSRAGIG